MRDVVTHDLERVLGGVLEVGTYAAIALVAAGVVSMVLTGRSPLAADAAPLDPGSIPGLIGAGRPEGLLWLGLVVAIATPIGRVGGALVGFVARGERILAGIATAILAVIATAVALGLLTG